MTHDSTDQSTNPDAGERRRVALIIRAGSAVLIAGTLLIPLVWSLNQSGAIPPYLFQLIATRSVLSLIAPALLLIFAGGVARGSGGAIALALVITCLQTMRGLLGIGIGMLKYGAFGWPWMLPGLVGFVVASVMAVASIRLWWSERSLWPEPHRIATARAAWKRARVAMTIAWITVFLFAAACIAIGAMLFIQDSSGIGGGIGIMLLVFGAVVAAGGVWMLLLWLRLRRHGPIVARSTAWQVAVMLSLWILLTAADGGGMGGAAIFATIPTAVLAWMLIELLHASLARNAASSGEGVIGGFDVVALDDGIPIAQIAPPRPPALPIRSQR